MTISIQRMLFCSDQNREANQQRAVELVEPLLPNIAAGFESAFNEFRNNILVETRSKLYPAVRGQNVTCLIWENVRDQLTDFNVEFCDNLGFFKVIVANEIVIRFKRLNGELLATSKDTEQAKNWFANEPISGVADHLMRVNFGYRPEHDWLSCQEFYLTHQTGFTTSGWVSDVTVDASESVPTSNSFGLPQVQISPLDPPVVNEPVEQRQRTGRAS